MPASLRAQVDAVEGAVLTEEGYLARVAVLWDHPKHGPRVQAESANARMWIGPMRDALKTMKFLLENETEFRELVLAKRRAARVEIDQ